MILTSNLGFPRIGKNRELKFALENYWKGELTLNELLQGARHIQTTNWIMQKELGLDFIPSNDFSFYDQVLDTSCLLGAIPDRFRKEKRLGGMELYFAMARGGQTANGQVLPAMEMTKWFNSNYHYLVPEINSHTTFELDPSKPLGAFQLAKSLEIETRPVLLGPVTYLLLAKSDQEGFAPINRLPDILPLYAQILADLSAAGVEWVQLDEPALCTDLDEASTHAYLQLFKQFSSVKDRPRVMLTAYFGDLAENSKLLGQSPFEGIHIDLFNCHNPDQLLAEITNGQMVSMGIVDGRNIWKNDLNQSLETIKRIHERYHFEEMVLSPSCSLLHVPQDVLMERNLPADLQTWLAFGKQKLEELVELKAAANQHYTPTKHFLMNQAALKNRAERIGKHSQKHDSSSEKYALERHTPFAQRKVIQQEFLKLPLLPTTTIGSFPQTSEIRKLRNLLQKGRISSTDYQASLEMEIEKTIRFQEEIGLDVLVHGEYERNDMVQYFAEKLEGFAFTEEGWVQSFGSRCVRPPIIFGNVNRPEPMTVRWAVYSQSLTGKQVKGMLTGPVTILQWSFVRDDQPRAQTCRQIAAAVRAEVLDLEKAGIRIIQIDEPALREGLPIQKKGWAVYLAWTVECFQIASAGVRDETQIHTHMCYAEFNDIMAAIAEMDADVISIEASRSKMELLKAFEEFNYPNDIGPGVYDIHSPNIPDTKEIAQLIRKALEVIPAAQLWINPDCGLKTRRWEEITPALKNMQKAVQEVREELAK